jgi:hypothetical protein
LSRQQFAWVIAWHNHAMATMATFIQTPAAAWSLSRSIDHAAPISSAQSGAFPGIRTSPSRSGDGKSIHMR